MRYDLTKFSFLATVGAPPGLWLVGPDSSVWEVQQAIDVRRKWQWASSGGMSGLGIGAAFTCEALKLDCHVVQGYKGSADAGLAVTRGEMDALYVPEFLGQQFRQGQAELGARHHLAHTLAVLPGSPDHLRGGAHGCGRHLGDGNFWPTSRSSAAS